MDLSTRRDDSAWMAYAACAGMDPELWFPVSAEPQDGFAAGRLRLALATCARCAVREECLACAVRTRQRGIWGGMTEGERRTSRRCRLLRLAAGMA